MADQICYAVLCVFSYVAAGTEKRLQLGKSLAPPTGPPSPMLNIPTIAKPQESTKESPPKEELVLGKTIPTLTYEAGSVTPVGGPPSYPPPALPPGVPPPAPPPGSRSFGSPAQLSGTRPLKPPPVPSRNLPPGLSSPQPPPRPK